MKDDIKITEGEFASPEDVVRSVFMDSKLSARKFASSVGFSPAYLCCVFKGTRRASWELLRAVAEVYYVEINYSVIVAMHRKKIRDDGLKMLRDATIAVRDYAILNDCKAGKTYRFVAAKHKISVSRVQQIISKNRRREEWAGEDAKARTNEN